MSESQVMFRSVMERCDTMEGHLRNDMLASENRLRGEMSEMGSRIDSKFDQLMMWLGEEFRALRSEMVTKDEFMELADEVMKMKWQVEKHEMQIRKLRKGRKK